MIVITTVLLILIAVLLFGLIIFVHEFGHFITAKAMGVKVNEFAIGMGPTLFKFQKGETKYALRLFPIGGFCAMEGEDEASEDARAFGNKKVWRRILIVIAGAVMNIIFGMVLMMVLMGQEDQFVSMTVAKFAENSVTDKAGLQVGDTFQSVNGYRIMCDNDFSLALALDEDGVVDVVVERDGQDVEIKNLAFATTDEEGQKTLSIDFYVEPIEKNFFTLIDQSFRNLVSNVRMVWVSLMGLLTGRFGFNELAGPIGMADVISQSAQAGLQSGNLMGAINNIIRIMVMITVNLGVVNLLPLPALDGGRLVFLVIEGIRRKPINPKYEGWVHAAGFVLLIGLMLVVAFSDVLRLITGKGLGG